MILGGGSSSLEEEIAAEASVFGGGGGGDHYEDMFKNPFFCCFEYVAWALIETLGNDLQICLMTIIANDQVGVVK